MIDALVAERGERGKASSGGTCASRSARCVTGERWARTQVKMHLRALQELEYVAVHRSGHAQRHVYELLHDAPQGGCGPFERVMSTMKTGRRIRPNRSVTGRSSGPPGFPA